MMIQAGDNETKAILSKPPFDAANETDELMQVDVKLRAKSHAIHFFEFKRDHRVRLTMCVCLRV